MKGAMPEIGGQGFDVSKEEQRFLKRCFRRFALPYVIGAFAVGALAGALPQWRAADAGEATAATDPRLHEEIAAIRSELATLSQRAVGAEATLAKTRDRLVALEQRAGGTQVDSTGDLAALEESLDAARRRMDALESRVGSSAAPSGVAVTRIEEQFATLGSRLARIEGELRATRGDAPPASIAP
jgi:hypothetical protein